VKYCGLELVGSNFCLFANNRVDGGSRIGVSLSNDPPKIYSLWAYNAVRGCADWAAHQQGDKGGVAYQYFFHCDFAGDGGNDLRINGNVRDVTFERCRFENSTVRMEGAGVDRIYFLRCNVADGGFSSPAPVVDFRFPANVTAGVAARFENTSVGGKGRIVRVLWDFGEGIPTAEDSPAHAFAAPGKYRVGLVVWDESGRAGYVEKVVEVRPNRE
jgi:hypothetical protein